MWCFHGYFKVLASESLPNFSFKILIKPPPRTLILNPKISFKIFTKIQHKILIKAQANFNLKMLTNFLIPKSLPYFSFKILTQMSSTHFFRVNISKNNIKKVWVGNFKSQSHICQVSTTLVSDERVSELVTKKDNRQWSNSGPLKYNDRILAPDSTLFSRKKVKFG